MKKFILSSFALAAFVFISNSVSAQDVNVDKPTTPATQTTTLGVKIATVMDLNQTAGSSLDLTFESASDLLDGKQTAVDAVKLNYKSNWKTYVSIKATDFVNGDASLTMPAGIIMFNTDGSTDFTKTMTNLEQDISGTSTVGNEPGKGDIKLTFKVTPTLKYAPANDYTSIITYTITAN